jgi:hypothetical protein
MTYDLETRKQSPVLESLDFAQQKELLHTQLLFKLKLNQVDNLHV